VRVTQDLNFSFAVVPLLNVLHTAQRHIEKRNFREVRKALVNRLPVYRSVYNKSTYSCCTRVAFKAGDFIVSTANLERLFEYLPAPAQYRRYDILAAKITDLNPSFLLNAE